MASFEPIPFEMKKQNRLKYMKTLYDSTNGSSMANCSMWELGGKLGWDRPTTEQTVEYLENELLIEPLGGGEIAITHLGVREVEASMEDPESATKHFPPLANVMIVNNMVGSNVQQGAYGSELRMEVMRPEVVHEAGDLLRRIREVLPKLDLDEDRRDELETELDVAQRQLLSKRPRAESVRASLHAIGGILGSANVLAGSSLQLATYAMKIHELLPGI